MIAARLHRYHDPLTVENVDEPNITDPHDIIVRMDGAGLLAGGLSEAELVSLRLRELPGGPDADRCREVRRELELGDDPDGPAFVTATARRSPLPS